MFYCSILNEASGTIEDTSGNSNDGTYNGALYSQSGVFNTSIGFDGDDRIDFGSSLDELNGSHGFTISAWVYPVEESFDGYKGIFLRGSRAPALFGWTGASFLRFNIGTVGQGITDCSVNSPNLNINEWNHVIATWNGTTCWVEVNGVSGSTDTTVGDTLPDSSGNEFVGYAIGYWNGSIDEVAVWNRTLSDEEKNQIYKKGSATHGTYTSQIFNAGSAVQWTGISWVPKALHGAELPDNQDVQTESVGTNMTGNVLLLHLNEASGTIVDTSGNLNNGTYNGALYSQDGVFNSAIGFNGTGFPVTVSNPSSIMSDQEIAVSAWFKRLGTGASREVIVSKGTYYHAASAFSIDYEESTTRFRFSTGQCYKYFAGVIDNDVWNHAVLTYKKDVGAYAYLNGELLGELNNGNCNQTIPLASYDITLGSNYVDYYFNGTIDEVAIWNRSLSETEIQNLYQRGLGDLNLSIQSCSSANCSDGTWTELNTNSTTQNFAYDNQYFQYQLNLSTTSIDFSPQIYNVTVDSTNLSCGETITTSTTLDGDLTCEGNAIIIGAADVTLDCNGHTITYGTLGDSTANRGVWWENYANITTKNCIILDGNETGTNGEGLYIPASYGGDYLVYNNSVQTYNRQAVYINTFGECNVSSNEFYVDGYLNSLFSDDAYFENNFFSSSSYTSTQGMVNTTFVNNTFYGNSGLRVYFGSSNNTFIGNNFTGNSRGIQLRNAGQADGVRNNVFKDCTHISGGAYDVEYANDAGEITNNTFLNCSYDISKELVQGAGNDLIKKWYYQTYVNYTNGDAINNAFVTAYNSSGGVEFNVSTNSSGWIEPTPITDYVNTAGTRAYYSNYTINATDGLQTESQTINITLLENSLTSFFTLQSDSVTPNLSINAPANNTNFTTTVNFNFTAYDDSASTLDCKLYLDSTLNSTNSSTLNNTLTNFEVTGISQGNHTWYITCADSASNTNTSDIYFFNVDISGPTPNSITYTPNSSLSIDPLIEMTITANITDSITSVQTAILQLYNSSQTNYSLTNLGNNLYQVNLTLNSEETNYTFNIWTNDSLSNSNLSTNTTFEAAYDCSWTATSDLSSIVGYNENKFIGNITIDNDGDAMYSNNNCSLDFSLTYNLDYISDNGRIYYDGENFKNLALPGSLDAGESRNVSINTTFLTTIREESVIINITEFRSRSNTSMLNTIATLVTSQSGPYFDLQIINSPANVDLTSNTFALNGTLRNLLGSSVFNETNTAYNVTLYWILPSGITNSSGKLNNSITNMSYIETNYTNILAEFSELASMSPGTQTVYLRTIGYNFTGNLISNANNNTIWEESATINLQCYNTSDGICVTSCGYTLDSDCEAPTTTTTVTTTTTSGSGGGGGGSSTTSAITTTADYQLIRGKQNEIIVPFTNRNKNASLTELTFDVTGNIAKYIEISPKEIDRLFPEERINLKLKITSPTYIELGRQEIIILIRGKKTGGIYAENKKITLEIHELTEEEALELLEKSLELIKKFNQEGFNYSYLEELYNESLQAKEIAGYEKIRDNYKLIKQNVDNAIEAKKIISELEEKISVATEKGIDTSSSTRLMKLAKLSLERNDFSDAIDRAKEAQVSYVLETKGKIGRITYYVKENPKEIGIGIFFVFLFSVSAYKISKLQNIRNKIKKMKEEEKILGELIKAVQKECFEERKMSMDEYEQAMAQYHEKISYTIQELIRLETERAHLLKFTSKNKKLQNERNKVIQMIKDLQEDYLKNGRIETKRYYLTLESYNKRLTEIDEKLSLLEAKKAFKKGAKQIK